MNNFKQKKFLVMGLGISGKSVTKFLLEAGAIVYGFDEKITTVEIAHENFTLVDELIDGLECLIFSPGIPPQHWLLQEAKEKMLSTVGEAEFSARILSQSNKLIAITGTNGKTTVTLLLEHLLRSCGIDAHAAGNVGIPLSSFIGQENKVFVVEMSSFQIESMKEKVFSHALILNISPDHLDRYANYEAYARAKLHLQACVKSLENFYVDDEILCNWPNLLGNKSQSFEKLAKEKIEYILGLRYTEIRTHDEKNLLAAYALSKHFGVSEKDFVKATKTFKKPPHRLELIKEFNNIQVFNDSKATNAEAVIEAVNSLEKEIILIAGGSDKGLSYNKWPQCFADKVVLLCAIGQTKNKLKRVLGHCIRVKEFDKFQEAVSYAVNEAKSGQKILLSPGAASFDMFANFEERGNVFKKLVSDLIFAKA